MTGHPVFAKIFSLFFNNFQVPDEILNDESIETTMKSKTDDEVKFEDEDEIETTMLPMIDDDMVSTLVCRIDVQAQINVQVGKFLKNIKSAGQNRRAGGKLFLKINKRADQNKTMQGGIFSQN